MIFKNIGSITQAVELRRTKSDYNYQRNIENIYCRKFNDLKVCHLYYTYDRRVTEVATHYSKPIAISATKSGGITLHGINDKIREIYKWEGRGPGHSIVDVKFLYNDDCKMLTASLDGTVKLWDLATLRDKPCYIRDKYCLLDTNDFLKWYCSVSQSPSSYLTYAGCNKGFISILDKDFKCISQIKVHKSKINSLDFNLKNTNLFATSSLDRSCKIFDVRKLDKSVETISHSSPLNTAVFSKRNGCRLLVSDQSSDINIYSGPLWTLERTIKHPHRKFQHLTPIRASWHPFLDLIVIGRYPDKNVEFYGEDIKSVDIFSAQTGELKAELVPNSIKPIITSICEFSYTGDILITGTGSIVLFWRFINNDYKSEDKNKMTDYEEDKEDIKTYHTRKKKMN